MERQGGKGVRRALQPGGLHPSLASSITSWLCDLGLRLAQFLHLLGGGDNSGYLLGLLQG